MNTTRRIAGNAAWLFVGSAISKLIEFAAFVYLARVLAANGFGLFSLAAAIVAYLLIVIDGGSATLGIREISQNKALAAKIGLNIYLLRLVLAALVYFCSAIILLVINITPQLKMLLLFTFIILFSRAMTIDWIFQGLEQMKFVALSRVLQQVCFFLLILFMVKSFGDLLLVPLIMVWANVFVAVLLLFIYLKYFSRFNLVDLEICGWWPRLVAAFPLGLASMLILIYYNLDVIMLSFMQNMTVVGWYNAAYKLIFVVIGIIGVFSAAVFPTVCKYFSADKIQAKKFLEKYFRLLIIWTLPLVVLGFFSADWLIQVIYGSAYLSGSSAFRLLLLTILLISFSGIYGTLVLLPAGKNREFMISVGLGALVNIGLNIWLIPKFSLTGAALATLLTEIVVAGSFFFWARAEISLRLGQYIIKPALAGGVALVITMVVVNFGAARELNLLIRAMFSFTVVYSVLIACLGEAGFLWDFVGEILRIPR